MEVWRDGKMEGWRDGGMEGWREGNGSWSEARCKARLYSAQTACPWTVCVAAVGTFWTSRHTSICPQSVVCYRNLSSCAVSLQLLRHSSTTPDVRLVSLSLGIVCTSKCFIVSLRCYCLALLGHRGTTFSTSPQPCPASFNPISHRFAVLTIPLQSILTPSQVQRNTPLASVPVSLPPRPDPVGHRHILHPEWCTRHADEIANDIPAKLRQDLQRIRQSYDMGPKLSDAYKTADPLRTADAYEAPDPTFRDMAYNWLKVEKQRLEQQEAELQSRQANMMQLAKSTTQALQQVQQQHQTDVQVTWHVQHEQMQQSLAALRSQVEQQQHVLLDFQNLQQERLSVLAAKEREAETLLASLKKRETNLMRREELFEEFIRRRLAAEDEAHRILWNQVCALVLLGSLNPHSRCRRGCA